MLYNKCIASDIKVFHIDFPERGTKGLRKNIKRIKCIIKDNHIQIVHSNTNYDRTAGAFAARGTKAKHITSLHSLESIRHNITHYIRNKFLTHRYIADGETIKRLIVNQNKINPGKISVVNNGINPDEMKKNHELRNVIRNEFGIGDNEILIGNVARLVQFKGHKYLLNAFKIINESFNNVKLMIVGDGERFDSLNEYTSQMKIKERVFFTGFRKDLQSLYSSFDIYAHSSIEGGGELFPFSVLYAMAQQIPIVASRVGDVPSMIQDGVNGYLVAEKSPYQIAEKLSALISNPELRINMGKNGLKILEENFTVDKMVSKIEEIYAKVQK
jgi:glycosyltransferase involved in cell wall biosynthesis